MRRRSIAVDRLTVRLRHVPAATAREVGGELGRDLIHELARRQSPDAPAAGGRIDRIDSGRASVSAGASAGDLRRAIVNRVAAAIRRAGK